MIPNLDSKILYVVDDTAFLRASLIKLLTELGFDKSNIHQFDNGLSALNSLREDRDKVDLIISDWNMPMMNGFEFLKNLRKSEGAISKLPVVMITTVSEKEKIIEALKYKLSGYLLKPLQAEKLEEAVKTVFGLNEEED